jgi:hypothetical protein
MTQVPSDKSGKSSGRLEHIVAEARRSREQREQDYREKAIRMYPWICGRCQREFARANLHELTVHHRDHNHDNNPPDGSNWELLCLYCHDNEHARYIDAAGGSGVSSPGDQRSRASHKPFADLKALLEGKK